jgi:hypothetical protein
MNDVLVLVGVGVVVAAFVWFFIIRDTDEKTDVYVGKPKDPPKQQGGPGAPGRDKKAPKKLPTAKSMESMSKAKLEELGRDMGIELDKRKTKAKMIADLRLGVK